MINRDLCIASALGNIEAWNPHVGITHSCYQKYRYLFFSPQCLQQVSSKVCNFVNANIDDYKPLCNYLSHTSHLQIKWQLWAYTYAFLPLYFHHISAFESSHVIPCSYVHIMFSFTLFMSSIFTILFTHISSISSHGPSPSAFWKPSRRPAAPFAGRTPKAERWSLARREVHGVHGTFFLGTMLCQIQWFFFRNMWDLQFRWFKSTMFVEFHEIMPRHCFFGNIVFDVFGSKRW